MTTTTNDTERRIYVADLAAYNAGTLHGVWIDADQDADAIEAEVKAMLRASPEPNVEVDCPNCDGGKEPCEVRRCHNGKVPSAEEWAIYGSEGFGQLVGEFTSFADVAALAAALREHGEVFRLFLENGEEMPEAVERFEEAYCGEWKDEKEFAWNLLDDMGEIKGDSLAERYFDIDAFTRDLFMGDYWYDSGHVFRRM